MLSDEKLPRNDLTVFISSAHYGLERHRAIAEAAIKEAQTSDGRVVGALRTETGGAASFPPLAACLERIQGAFAVLMILGYRYGSIIADDTLQRSYTEAEYDEAVRLDKPLFVFLAKSPRDFDRGAVDPDVKRVSALREKVLSQQRSRYMIRFFGDVDDFADGIRRTMQEELRNLIQNEPISGQRELVARRLPTLIVHPFQGMNRQVLFGRNNDLKDIDRWADDINAAGLIIEAEGGMGKSSLAWEWYSHLDKRTQARDASPRFAGKLWWSCYERGATIAALGQEFRKWLEGGLSDRLKSRKRDDWQAIAEYLVAMDRPPLVVVDGLEAEFIGYAGRRPGELGEAGPPQTEITRAWMGVSGVSVRSGDESEDRFADFLDINAGEGLLALVTRGLIKVVFTTRHTPETFKDVQNPETGMKGGLRNKRIDVLSVGSARELLTSRGVFGSESMMTGLLSVDSLRHPLLLVGLGGAIKKDPIANGNLDTFVEQNPDFNLASTLRRGPNRPGILSFVMSGLNETETCLLNIIATQDVPLPASIIIHSAQKETNSSSAVIRKALRYLEETRNLIHSSVESASQGGQSESKTYSMHPVYGMFIRDTRLQDVRKMAVSIRPEYERQLFQGIGRDETSVSRTELDSRIMPILKLTLQSGEYKHAWGYFQYLISAMRRFGAYGSAFDQIRYFVTFNKRSGHLTARSLVVDAEAAVAVLWHAGELFRLFGDSKKSCACWHERARLIKASASDDKELELLSNNISLLLAEREILDEREYAERVGREVANIEKSKIRTGLDEKILILASEATTHVHEMDCSRLGAMLSFVALQSWLSEGGAGAVWYVIALLRRVANAPNERILKSLCRRNILGFMTSDPRNAYFLLLSGVEDLLAMGSAEQARECFNWITDLETWEGLDFAERREYLLLAFRANEITRVGRVEARDQKRMVNAFNALIQSWGQRWRKKQLWGVRMTKIGFLLKCKNRSEAKRELRLVTNEVLAAQVPQSSPLIRRIREFAEQINEQSVLDKLDRKLPAAYSIEQLAHDPVYGFVPALNQITPVEWS